MEYYKSKKSYDWRWRNPKRRLVSNTPLSTCRKPEWRSWSGDCVSIDIDEIDALKLKYLDGMHLIEACQIMWISKSLFGQIVNNGLYKLIEGIVWGKTIIIKQTHDLWNGFGEPII